ncbi:hypothetical protein ACIA8G_06225 [Lentzea sp. NPDC051213]|uniref:hypothetical protein n=1 Tax=Lentzea sp. NPDC051213 TaxID=3364126 RepID=UPI0037AABB37
MIGEVEPRSLLAMVEAASASPTASHRNISLALLFHAVVQRRGRKGPATSPKMIDPSGLARLVAEVGEAVPGVDRYEDCVPFDNRLEVLVRWGPELYRLLAGALERPVSMVNELSLLATVIDPVLVRRLGFGLADVGELVLRRVDQVARGLASQWPDGEPADVGDEARITQAELDAVAELPHFGNLIAECSYPDRAVAAARNYTIDARDLQCSPFAGISMFGTAVAVRVRGATVPIPASMLVESLLAISAELAGTAAQAHPRADAVYARAVMRRVANLLQGAGHRIGGPVRTPAGREFHSIVRYRERQYLALHVAAGLTPAAIQARLAEGEASLHEVRAGMELQLAGGTLALPPDAKIVRAQITSGPQLGVPLQSDHPIVPIGDLEWILRSIQSTKDDLWYFVRDLDSTPGVQHSFAWDLIDKFEVWRTEKSFYRGGRPVTYMPFAPHESIAEWLAAAENAPVERALHRLALPPLRDWPMVETNRQGSTEVADLKKDRPYRVLPWVVPVAIASSDPGAPAAVDVSLLWNLAAGVAWKLTQVKEEFTTAAISSGRKSLRITFDFHADRRGSPLTVDTLVGDVLSIGWDMGLQDALAEDSFAVERLLAEIVSSVFAAEVRHALVAAWCAAPPGIRIDAVLARQRARRLPDPLAPHVAVRSDVLRRLGGALAQTGAVPGVREGQEAVRFESRTVFPWLLQEFHRTISGLSGDGLLKFAVGQLERVHSAALVFDQKSQWERGFPVRGYGDWSAKRQKVSKLTRTVSLAVEEVLAHPPDGDREIDDLAWIEVITVAELCVESCFRSDALHHQLTRTAVELTGNYEVDIIDSDEPTDIDIAAYHDLRDHHTMPEGIPISTGSGRGSDEEEAEEEGPRAVLDKLPQLAPIDREMRTTLGFGIDALVGVLNVAAQWEADPATSATLVSPLSVVDECVDLVAGADQAELAAALDWLTLRAGDLQAETIPHWETERRDKRIATSPFVECAGGLWVLPWAAEYTRRIVGAYLSDGRLPWPDKALPEKLSKVLNQYRQRQNREAEKECAAALSRDGLVVRPSLTPQKAAKIGIPQLRGEIDALCIDPDRSRIWVVEVKDPYTPYSSYQIRSLIKSFNNEDKYVDRLLNKVRDVATSSTAVAAALKVRDSERPWTVVGLMATRHPEPAAFTHPPRVAFCLLADVYEIVTDDELVEPGPHGSSARSA